MKRILLVEDNEMSRDMLKRRLERSGFELLESANGEDAVAVARTAQPDLILMDMSLPVMDGWEATKRIKLDEAVKTIPVIALTAHAMSGDRDKALSAGCDDYEIKPINFPALLSKINALLGMK